MPRTRILKWVTAGSIALIGLLALTSQYGRLALNVTPSLPHRLYWIDTTDTSVIKGQLIAFRTQRMAPLPDGVTAVKIVRGVAGDVITVIARHVYINGEYVGLAKTQATSGEALDAIDSQTIPEGKVFVWALHPDSFDSRYASMGLIDLSLIVGRARALF